MSKEQEHDRRFVQENSLAALVTQLAAIAGVCAEGSVNNSCKDGKAVLNIAVQGRYCLSVTVVDADICGGVTVSGIPGLKAQKIASGNSSSFAFFVVNVPVTVTIDCDGHREVSNSCRFTYRLTRG